MSELSEEHRMLKDLVAKFVDQELIPLERAVLAREAAGGKAGLSDAEEEKLLARCKELGLWALDVPEEIGGANLPAVALEARSPWKTKAEFQADFKSPRMGALRNWLAGNVGLQTDFIVARSRAALPKILAAAPGSEKARIEANYHKVSTTSQGIYALIDYVNFKGDGTQVSERYNGRGWGLLQVLGEMKEVPSGAAAATEFAAAAKRVLSRRIANSPPERGEKRWEEGWHNRCGTYGRPL